VAADITDMSIATDHLSPLAWPDGQALQLLLTHALPVLIMAALAVLLVVLFTFHSAEPLREPVAPQEAAPPQKPAILLVDDSAVARAKLRKLFESAGYRAVVAHDGVQALEALSQDFFSVLITDLEMPNMTGMELIAAVHGSIDTDDLPTIAITGHDAMQARVQDLGGLYGIFKKPWNDRELLRRVEVLSPLRQRPVARAGDDAAAAASMASPAVATPV
jgi:CheY-like chemotaxis protein